MKGSYKKGVSFGIVSGIITTLGLIVGLDASTRSRFVVLGGIFTIAIADALSDAFGIHVSEEAGKKRSVKGIWEATLSTFFAKLLIALTFIIPVLLFNLSTAIITSVVYGLLLIGVLSYYTAKVQKIKPWRAILEHFFIACVVIILAYLVGHWVSITFV